MLNDKGKEKEEPRYLNNQVSTENQTDPKDAVKEEECMKTTTILIDEVGRQWLAPGYIAPEGVEGVAEDATTLMKMYEEKRRVERTFTSRMKTHIQVKTVHDQLLAPVLIRTERKSLSSIPEQPLVSGSSTAPVSETVHQTVSRNRQRVENEEKAVGFNQITSCLEQANITSDDSGRYVYLKFTDKDIAQSFTGLLLQLGIENPSEPGRARKISINEGEKADEYIVRLKSEEYEHIQKMHSSKITQFGEHPLSLEQTEQEQQTSKEKEPRIICHQYINQIGTLHHNNYALSSSCSANFFQPVQRQQDVNISEALRLYYQKAHATFPGLLKQPEQSIAKCYVNLAIVKQASQTQKEQKRMAGEQADSYDNRDSESEPLTEILRDERLHNWEDIYQPTKMIEIENLFTPDRSEGEKGEPVSIHKILIVGRAGIGKSTLCQYLAYRWAIDADLWKGQFERVYWIRLKEFIAVVEETGAEDLACALYHYLDKDPKNVKHCHIPTEIVQADLESNRTLLILDGYDEVAQHYEGRTAKGKLLRELLAYTPIILTTRPYGVPPVSFDRCLENIGFSNEQIERYVRKMAKSNDQDKATAKTFCELLQANNNLWGIAHIPLNLNLLCQLRFLKEEAEEAFVFTDTVTLTQIYSAMSERLLRHYVIEKKGLDKKVAVERSLPELIELCNTELRFLEALAFEGLKKRRLLIDESIVRQVIGWMKKGERSIVESALESGFLKNIDINKDQTAYYYIHLTFQEYLAAQYLVRGLNEVDTRGQYFREVLGFIEKEKYRPEYRMLFQFTAGLLSQCAVNGELGQRSGKKEGSSSGMTVRAPEALAYFWDVLVCSEQDLIGLPKIDLWLSCLAEARKPGEEEVDSRILHQDYLFEELRRWVASWVARGTLYRKNLLVTFGTILSRYPYAWKRSNNLIACLKAGLQANNWVVRNQAQAALAALSCGAPTAVLADTDLLAGLKAGLQASNWVVRNQAQAALEALSRGAPTAVLAEADLLAGLKAGLHDDDRDLRNQAQAVLATLSRGAPTAVLAEADLLTVLKAGLQDNDWEVRRQAQAALEALSQSAPMVVLSDTDLLAWLKVGLQDNERKVRGQAQAVLAALSRGAPRAVLLDIDLLAWLKAGLHDNDWVVRSKAQAALEALSQSAPTVVLSDTGLLAWLKAGLQVGDWVVRRQALKVLTALSRGAATAVLSDTDLLAGLKAGLQAGDWVVHIQALKVLTALSRGAPSAVLADADLLVWLKAGLRDNDNKDVRRQAQEAFAALSRNAPSAVLADADLLVWLKAGLRDNDNKGVRRQAREAFAALSRNAPTAVLADADLLAWLKARLQDNDWEVRNQAQEALEALSRGAPTAVLSDTDLLAWLKAGLQDNDWEVRNQAQEALKALSRGAPTAVLADTDLLAWLKAGLQASNWGVRNQAQEALKALSRGAPMAVLAEADLLVELVASVYGDNNVKKITPFFTAQLCLETSSDILKHFIKAFFSSQQYVCLQVMPDKLVLQINQQPPTEAVAKTAKEQRRLQEIFHACEAEAKAAGLPLTVYDAWRKKRSVAPRMLPHPLPTADTATEISKPYSEENKRSCRPM